MTQFNAPGPARSRPDADSDIYTVLLIIAALALLVSAIYVGYRAYTLFGSLLPPGGG